MTLGIFGIIVILAFFALGMNYYFQQKTKIRRERRRERLEDAKQELYNSLQHRNKKDTESKKEND